MWYISHILWDSHHSLSEITAVQCPAVQISEYDRLKGSQIKKNPPPATGIRAMWSTIRDDQDMMK